MIKIMMAGFILSILSALAAMIVARSHQNQIAKTIDEMLDLMLESGKRIKDLEILSDEHTIQIKNLEKALKQEMIARIEEKDSKKPGRPRKIDKLPTKKLQK